MDSVSSMILLAEVAETGSFTRAGERMGLPKSTVSHRIAQLERELGLRLLNRSTRQVTLTGSGQVYLDYCRRVRAEVSAAGMAMSGLKEEPAGRLKITCPEVTASYFMPALLRGFMTLYPHIEVDLAATNQHLDIIGEQLDFAFRVGPTSGQDMVIRRISSIRRVLVASPAYLTASGPMREPSDLLEHRCLVHDAQPEWIFSAGEASVRIRAPQAAVSDSMGFLLHFCIAGGGAAVLPAYICQPHIAAGTLAELLPGWAIPPHDMMLVSPSLQHRSRSQIAFRDYVTTFDFSALTAPR